MTDEELYGNRDCERNSTGAYRHGWKIFMTYRGKIYFGFTMVGMETKGVVVGKQTGINVVMKDVVVSWMT
ncbi:MAG: hypothetical protein ACLU4J_11725 [Butyricimonas paravirosa]